MKTADPGVPKWPPLFKSGSSGRPSPVMKNYHDTCHEYSWDTLRADLGPLPDGTLNIAYAAIDRPASSMPDKLALRFIDQSFAVQDFTFADLKRGTSQFAAVLQQSGVGPGAVVATLLGRCPELFLAAFGALKCGAMYSPLFSAFGPEPIRSRLELAAASTLVTTARLYSRKVQPIRAQLPLLHLSLRRSRRSRGAVATGDDRLHCGDARYAGDFHDGGDASRR